MIGEFWWPPGKDLVLAALTVRSVGSASCSRSSSLRCSAAKQALMWWRSTPSTTSVPLRACERFFYVKVSHITETID